MRWLIAACLLAAGLLLVWLADRMRRRRMPLAWYDGAWPKRHGVTDEVWRAANAATWWLPLLAGVVLCAGAIGAVALIVGGGDDDALALAAIVATVTAVALTAAHGVAVRRACGPCPWRNGERG